MSTTKPIPTSLCKQTPTTTTTTTTTTTYSDTDFDPAPNPLPIHKRKKEKSTSPDPGNTGAPNKKAKKLKTRPANEDKKDIPKDKEDKPAKETAKQDKEEKAKHGFQGISDLLNAVKNETIYDGQGAKAKQVKKSDVIGFLRERCFLETRRESPFLYLNDRVIGEITAEQLKAHLSTLQNRYEDCQLLKRRGQIRIALSDREPATKDKEVGKIRGLMNIGTYALAHILEQGGDTRETLIEHLENGLNNTTVSKHYAHLCKKDECINPRHLSHVPASVNIKSHETCPGMWIIHNTLVNCCTCHVGIKCIAPGKNCNIDLFKDMLTTVNTIHPPKSEPLKRTLNSIDKPVTTATVSMRNEEPVHNVHSKKSKKKE